MKRELERLNKKREKILKRLHPFGEMIRGTLIKWYGECKNPGCKCHQDKNYRHGPYYRISYSKGGRIHHVYVPSKKKKEVRILCNNYKRIWQGIEDISEINIKLIKLKK